MITSPRPLRDHGFGAAPESGHYEQLSPLIGRLCAPNPGPLTGPGTNTYFIGGADSPLVVLDPGPKDGTHLANIERVIAERNATIGWIVLTHHHIDHAPLAQTLSQRSGAPVVAHGHEKGVTPDVRIDERWHLTTGSVSLRAIATPGHASDHCCFLLEEEGVLFSGDHLMDGVTVVISPPDGDLKIYEDSLCRIEDPRLGIRSVAPGHGRLLREPGAVVEEVRQHRRAREEKIISHLSKEAVTIDELVVRAYDDLSDARLLPYAKRSLWAHLRKLHQLGVVERLGEGETEQESSRWRTT